MIILIILFAKSLAVFFIIIGFGMLINSSHTKDMMKDLSKHTSVQFVAGVVPMILGLVILSLHHILVQSWVLLITLVGYLFLMIGVFRILFPNIWISVMQHNIDTKLRKVIASVMLFIGLYFLYFGFL